jgi:hypothetical protein
METPSPDQIISARINEFTQSIQMLLNAGYDQCKRRLKSAAGGGRIVRHLEAVNCSSGWWSSPILGDLSAAS